MIRSSRRAVYVTAEVMVARTRGVLIPVKLDAGARILGTADGDLFAALSRVGEALTTEPTDLVNLLIGGQDRVARQRMLQGRKRLLPLRRELSTAMSELQRIEASLGYVPPESRRRAGRGATDG